MLEDGRYTSVSDIARAEKLDRAYVGGVPRLTLLVPEIVEAIVDGRQPAEMVLPVLLKPFAVERVALALCGSSLMLWPAMPLNFSVV